MGPAWLESSGWYLKELSQSLAFTRDEKTCYQNLEILPQPSNLRLFVIAKESNSKSIIKICNCKIKVKSTLNFVNLFEVHFE